MPVTGVALAFELGHLVFNKDWWTRKTIVALRVIVCRKLYLLLTCAADFDKLIFSSFIVKAARLLREGPHCQDRDSVRSLFAEQGPSRMAYSNDDYNW